MTKNKNKYCCIASPTLPVINNVAKNAPAQGFGTNSYVTMRNNDIAIEQSSSLHNLKLTMILTDDDVTALAACTAIKLSCDIV